MTDPKHIEAVARALAEINGQYPDDDAPLSDMCGPNNEPRPWWRYYVIDAQASINALTALGWQYVPADSVVVKRQELVEAFTFPFPEPRSVKGWRFLWEHSIAPRYRAMINAIPKGGE